MPSPRYFQLANVSSSATGRRDLEHVQMHRLKPRILLKINDLSTKGSRLFLASIDVHEALQHAISTCLDTLYPAPSTTWPGTRTITLILKSMPGVAYTAGCEIDDDHKEVYLSTDYIESVSAARIHEEILGVITHEVVHTLQHNGYGTAPGGLIEGVADFVRLKAGYAPPHWKKELSDGDQWDRGYELTAFFLEFLDNKQPGSVVAINETLRNSKYEKTRFWTGIFEKDVDTLFKEYAESLKDASAPVAAIDVPPRSA